MKKGLRNTIASMALAGMSMFGGIKQAKADQLDSEAVVPKAKIVEMAKTLEKNTTWQFVDYENDAKSLLEGQVLLPEMLKDFQEKFNIDLAKYGTMRIFSQEGDEHGTYVNLDNKYFVFNNNGTLEPTKDLGNTLFSEGYGTRTDINLAKGTFKMIWSRSDGSVTKSPELSFAPAREKTAAKTLTPAAKKAVAEKRVHNQQKPLFILNPQSSGWGFLISGRNLDYPKSRVLKTKENWLKKVRVG